MRQRERRAFLQTLPLAPIAQEAHSQAYRKVGHPPPIMAGSAPAPSSCCQAGIPGRSLPAVGERETLIRINDESVPPAIFIPKEVVSHAV